MHFPPLAALWCSPLFSWVISYEPTAHKHSSTRSSTPAAICWLWAGSLTCRSQWREKRRCEPVGLEMYQFCLVSFHSVPKCDLSGFADSTESHHSRGDKCSHVAADVGVIPVLWAAIKLVLHFFNTHSRDILYIQVKMAWSEKLRNFTPIVTDFSFESETPHFMNTAVQRSVNLLPGESVPILLFCKTQFWCL